MAKTQPEVGAGHRLGGLPAQGAALALAAGLWLGFSPLANASGVEWQTYLSEDFSGTESMFYTGKAGEAFYSIDDKERYIVNGLDTESDSLSALTDSMYYYYVEASCELVSSDAKNLAFTGLVFHYKKLDDGTLAYYVFYIYGDGYYGAKRVIGDKVDIALPLTKSDEIDVGAPNVLAVEAQGSRFDLYINGKHVDGFTDLKLDGGGFGFYISKRSEGAFDDFKVKVEQRDTGQEPPEEPNSATDGAPTKFTSYSPPYIPKDPNRPVYPWEVGVDKSKKGKGKKPAEPVGKGARVEDAGGREEPGESKSDSKQPEKQKPANPNKTGSKVKPGEKKVEKPTAPPKVESKLKPPAKDDSAGQDQGAAPQDNPPPPKEEPKTGSDGAESNGTPSSADTFPPPEQDTSPAAPPEDQTPEPAARSVESSPGPPEPKIEKPEVQAPDYSEHSLPLAEPEQGSLVEPEPAVSPREPEHSEPVAEKKTKPFIRVEKEPKEDKPEPAKKTPASQPKANPAEGMRGKQDDWIDPNANTPVVEEIRPPVPAHKDAQPLQQEAPKQESSQLELPPAPNAAGVPEAATEAAPGEPEAQPAPAPEAAPTLAAEKTSSGDLALLPPEPDAASPTPEPAAPADAESEPSLPKSSEPTRLEDLPQIEHGQAPVVELRTPQALPQQPEAPPIEPEAPPVAPEAEPPAPALDLPPIPPAPPQPPAPQVDSNTVQVDDDFSQPHWAVAESPSCTYRYFGAAYEINNLNSATMALSFQQETLANVESACDVEFLDGVSYVGYGLAARFSAKDGVPTYYGLFVCQSGEFMLLRVIGGKETVLVQWTASLQLYPNQPNRIQLALSGATISAYINNELVTTVTDDAIASGGYALLAGPGVAARFDNFSLRGTR